jgi:4-hydroxybenzoate polyprenyltransferase
MTSAQIVPDSELRGLVAHLPPGLRDFALLARFDRPIGWWLLFWPCAWGVLLAGSRALADRAVAAAWLDRDARGGVRL